jgi:Right handed beta helix region
VTIKPAAGASATIGSINLQNVSHLHFTGAGGTLSVGSTDLDRSDTRPNCSSHITWDYLRFSVGISIYPRCAAMGILVDHDNLNNLVNHDGWDGRLNVQAMDQGPSTDQGITISNSTFNGGCSKGIQIMGGSYGIQVLNNEFANLSQSGCDPLHVGGIQVYGGSHIHLKGNYFHDNGDSAGGLSMPADGGRNVLVEDNVWVCTCIYPWSIQAAATQNSTFIHNTFAGGGGIHFYTEQGWVAAGNLVRDNVFTDSTNGITSDSASAGRWGAQDHNLDSGMSGPGDLTGTAVWTGGSHPTSYAGYHLASGSPGRSAASDGADMGIR